MKFGAKIILSFVENVWLVFNSIFVCLIFTSLDPNETDFNFLDTTVYKGYCEHDEQCHKFLGEKSLCKRAECVCNKDHVWYRGKCQPYSGKDGPCNNTHICYDKNDMIALTCISGKCSCSSSYYDRGPDCRRYDWPFRCE